MRIRWYGHSCFEVSDSKNTIVLDPNDGKSIGIKAPSATANIVLMTHDHYDHNNAKTIQGNFVSFKQAYGKYEKNGFEFEGFKTFHDNENGNLRGENAMYLFEMDGMKVCHCGDLGAIPSDDIIERIKNVDFFMVPVGGTYTLEIDELIELITKVNPKIIIPMHYSIPGLCISLNSVDKFLEIIPEPAIEYVGNEIDLMVDELPSLKECWVFTPQ